MPNLYPRLIVAEPDAAIAAYANVFGATLIERFTDPQGRVVHAALQIGGDIFSIAQSVREWGLLDPHMLGGSASLIHLEVADPDAVASAIEREGGEIVVSIADRPWGKREGRVKDAAGHLWLLSKRIEDVDAEEIARRLRS